MDRSHQLQSDRIVTRCGQHLRIGTVPGDPDDAPAVHDDRHLGTKVGRHPHIGKQAPDPCMSTARQRNPVTGTWRAHLKIARMAKTDGCR